MLGGFPEHKRQGNYDLYFSTNGCITLPDGKTGYGVSTYQRLIKPNDNNNHITQGQVATDEKFQKQRKSIVEQMTGKQHVPLQKNKTASRVFRRKHFNKLKLKKDLVYPPG